MGSMGGGDNQGLHLKDKFFQTDKEAKKEFVVTPADLKILLDELQSVQKPEHEFYQGWFEEETRQQWLAHIRSVQQTLNEHA